PFPLRRGGGFSFSVRPGQGLNSLFGRHRILPFYLSCSPWRLPMARPSMLIALGALAAAVACAPVDDTATTTTAASPSTACTKDELTLLNPGKLTIGTDKPAYEPWFKDDDPANGQGFESAVAYAVAGELGFQRD